MSSEPKICGSEAQAAWEESKRKAASEAGNALAKLRHAKLTPERRKEIAMKAALSPRPNAKNAGRPKKKKKMRCIHCGVEKGCAGANGVHACNFQEVF